MQDFDLVKMLSDLPSAAELETKRVMEVCNACRYCEGFCAVFPAMTLQRHFASGDLNYLANLCHSCQGCYYACQYAPPHEFGINVPKALSELRLESYEQHAWPRPVAALYRKNALVISILSAACITGVLLLAAIFNGDALFARHASVPGGGFYNVIPYQAMVAVAVATFLYSALALAIGLVRFSRAIGLGIRVLYRHGPVLRALRDAATLRYLGGSDGEGCNDADEAFSTTRRKFHHALAYGFGLCFAATATGTVYDHMFSWPAPYALFSLPVVLGTVGGIGMVVGAIGLLWLKLAGEDAPRSPALLGPDVTLLVLLLAIAATGLLLLAVRSTEVMGVALAVHLGVVLAFFLVMPYSKFVHGIFRLAALVRHHSDREARDGFASSPPTTKG